MAGITIGLIGGTGLGKLLGGREGERHDVDTPFGPPSDAIMETQWEGLRVLLLGRHGPGHIIPPSQVPYRANIFALKQLGCTHIIASGAVGSLRQEFMPRQLVIPDQIINRTTRRPDTFYDTEAVHVEFAEPFCPILRQKLLSAAKNPPDSPSEPPQIGDSADASASQASAAPQPAKVHDRGCYVCMEGPAFSTRAESLMHRLWGGDLIGMTAMPEAKLAREAELPYALVALVTDYDCWKSKPALSPSAGAPVAAASDPSAPASGAAPELLLREIMHNLDSAANSAMELIGRTLRIIAADPSPLDHCPAATALKFAIWSEKSRIAPDQVERLSPLWGKYFNT